MICLNGDGSLLSDYQQASRSVHVIGRRHLLDVAALARAVECIRRINPTICHTYLYISNLFGGWAARLAGVPLVIAAQRGLGIDPRHSWFKRLEQRVMNVLIGQFTDAGTVNARAVAGRAAALGCLWLDCCLALFSWKTTPG